MSQPSRCDYTTASCRPGDSNFAARLRDHPEDSLAHPFLTTGLCGTLTTFSTLQLELFEMVEGGHLGLAAAYVAATLAAGFLFVRLGIALERRPEPAR